LIALFAEFFQLSLGSAFAGLGKKSGAKVKTKEKNIANYKYSY